jgi:predicted GIY-YIG superfamily endonuclease
MYEHQQKLVSGFMRKDSINRLVYCETTSDVRVAVAREQ